MEYDGITYFVFDKECENNHGFNEDITKDITLEYLMNSNIEYKNELDDDWFKLDQFPKQVEVILFDFIKFVLEKNNKYVKVYIIGLKNDKIEEIFSKYRSFIILLCKFHLRYEYVYNEKPDVNKIIETVSKVNSDMIDEVIEQPKYGKCIMYEYQKKTVNWMIQREKEEKSIPYCLNGEIIVGDYVIDINKNKYGKIVDNRIIDFKGGALIDEVGLGKTYEMIVLSLTNKRKNTKYIQKKYNKLCGKGTIVFCPNHLCNQWIKEIKKMVNKDLKIIPLFTKVHYDKYTYQDLLDADFVIVSFNFMINNAFVKSIFPNITKQTFIQMLKNNFMNTKNIIDDLALKVKKDENILEKTNSNPVLIHWHRVIVDEFHEITDRKYQQYMENILYTVDSTYRWCMTGTPFDRSTDCLMMMIGFVSNVYNLPDSLLLNDHIYNHVVTKFFRKNTKKSIINEYKLLPLKESVIWLKFSDIERNIYEAYLQDNTTDKFDVKFRQLCCHPSLVDELKMLDKQYSQYQTLEEIENKFNDIYKNNIVKSTRKINRINKSIDNILKFIMVTSMKEKGKLLKKFYKIKYIPSNCLVSDNVNYNAVANHFIYKLDNEIEDENKNNEEITNDIANFYIDDIANSYNDMINNKIENEKDVNEKDVNEKDVNEKDVNEKDVNKKDVNKKDVNEKDVNEKDVNNEKPEITLVFDKQEEIDKLLEDHNLVYEESEKIKEMIKTMKRYILKKKNETEILEGKKKTYEYYNNVISHVKDTFNKNNFDEECAICRCEIKKNDMALTKCGHLYCYNCINEWLKINNKCPLCNSQIDETTIYRIKNEIKNEFVEGMAKTKIDLINKFGTKITHLILYLKHIDKHVIIFSQWDELLVKIGGILNNEGIKNVFCHGNVWQRNNTICKFNSEDDIKIIMLSSGSCASGTNLTKAEIVILLDPVYGSFEYRKNVEMQAIGRAYRLGQDKQVEVVRFIIKDSIEEDIYKINNEDDEKNNALVKKFEIDDAEIQ